MAMSVFLMVHVIQAAVIWMFGQEVMGQQISGKDARLVCQMAVNVLKIPIAIANAAVGGHARNAVHGGASGIKRGWV